MEAHVKSLKEKNKKIKSKKFKQKVDKKYNRNLEIAIDQQIKDIRKYMAWIKEELEREKILNEAALKEESEDPNDPYEPPNEPPFDPSADPYDPYDCFFNECYKISYNQWVKIKEKEYSKAIKQIEKLEHKKEQNLRNYWKNIFKKKKRTKNNIIHLIWWKL